MIVTDIMFFTDGGGGSGKSYFVMQKLVIKALKSKRKILFTRQTLASMKDSVWQGILDAIEYFHLTQYVTTNKTDMKIEFPNGSILLFKGLENIERLKSIVNITDICIEEASEISYEAYNQLDIRLRHPTAPNQQIYLMFNPVSKMNWTYKHFFRDGTPPNTRIIHTTYKDNKFLPDTQIDVLEALKYKDEAYYRIYALGEFGVLDKLIFNNYEIRYVTEEEIFGTQIAVGLDAGYSQDPTAICKVAYDKKTETLYILDEIYETELTTRDIYDRCIEKGMDRYHITADSAEPRLIKELKNLGLSIKASKKGPDSILYGINWLKARKIVIMPHCINAIEEFKNYTWKKDKKTGEYYDVPIDKFNHLIDSLRYRVEQHYTRSNLKTLQKSALGIG